MKLQNPRNAESNWESERAPTRVGGSGVDGVGLERRLVVDSGALRLGIGDEPGGDFLSFLLRE